MPARSVVAAMVRHALDASNEGGPDDYTYPRAAVPVEYRATNGAIDVTTSAEEVMQRLGRPPASPAGGTRREGAGAPPAAAAPPAKNLRRGREEDGAGRIEELEPVRAAPTTTALVGRWRPTDARARPPRAPPPVPIDAPPPVRSARRLSSSPAGPREARKRAAAADLRVQETGPFSAWDEGAAGRFGGARAAFAVRRDGGRSAHAPAGPLAPPSAPRLFGARKILSSDDQECGGRAAARGSTFGHPRTPCASPRRPPVHPGRAFADGLRGAHAS
eukprot:tig00020944_g16342.t1